MRTKYRGFPNRKIPIIMFRKTYPTWTMTKIARKVMCTKQYVYTILKEEGLPTRALKPTNYCEICKEIIEYSSTVKTCKSCRSKNRLVILNCSFCGKEFEKRKSEYVSRLKDNKYKGNFFCSRKCFYEWRRK